MSPNNITRPQWVNSLAPRRRGCNFDCMILKHISVSEIFIISCGTALKWMPQDHTDDELSVVQVMAWCRQATSHYLSQVWPWYMPPCHVASPGHNASKNHLQFWNNILTLTPNYICSPTQPFVLWVACLHILKDHNTLLSYYDHTIFQQPDT